MLKIGYQGVPGSYSEMGVIQYFGTETTNIPYDNFREMIVDVDLKRIDFALLPIENSTTGAITRSLDLMKDYNVYMIGEEFVNVSHCLITFEGVSFNDVKTIYSHPEALKQCDDFFDRHKQINKVAYLDTAKSVEYIIQLGDKTAGAIASKRAAQLHNMQILAENIQDNKLNITRFAVISNKNIYEIDADTVSIYVVTSHTSGSLFQCIKVISENNVNMLKIESRPIHDKPFSYGFYIDFEGQVKSETTLRVLESLKTHCEYIKIIGNYKKKLAIY
ncbi:MAG: prephenate dehydratase [Dethiosulfatibacter sp.]|nr:prephenate dehydratase [Dethiosulfatibacter sp.]